VHGKRCIVPIFGTKLTAGVQTVSTLGCTPPKIRYVQALSRSRDFRLCHSGIEIGDVDAVDAERAVEDERSYEPYLVVLVVTELVVGVDGRLLLDRWEWRGLLPLLLLLL